MSPQGCAPGRRLARLRFCPCRLSGFTRITVPSVVHELPHTNFFWCALPFFFKNISRYNANFGQMSTCSALDSEFRHQLQVTLVSKTSLLPELGLLGARFRGATQALALGFQMCCGFLTSVLFPPPVTFSALKIALGSVLCISVPPTTW